MLEAVMFIIGFEGIILAGLIPMWNNEGLIRIKKYLELVSMFCGFGGLTLYYYLRDYSNLKEIVFGCGVFWGLSSILIIYVVFFQKKSTTQIIDVPEGSYEVVIDDTKPIPSVQPVYRLIYDNNVYTIAAPIASGKPHLKLVVTSNETNKVQFADVIVKGYTHKTLKERFQQLLYTAFNILALCIPFICLWFHDADKTVKCVIFLIFGYGTCMLKDAQSILQKLLYYFSLFVCVSMLLSIIL